jgi:hypothetical protein
VLRGLEAGQLKAVVALFVVSYNFTWCHRTLKGLHSGNDDGGRPEALR